MPPHLMGTIDYVQMSTECLTGSLTVSSTLARGYILARSRQYRDIGKSTAADRRSVLGHKNYVFIIQHKHSQPDELLPVLVPQLPPGSLGPEGGVVAPRLGPEHVVTPTRQQPLQGGVRGGRACSGEAWGGELALSVLNPHSHSYLHQLTQIQHLHLLLCLLRYAW